MKKAAVTFITSFILLLLAGTSLPAAEVTGLADEYKKVEEANRLGQKPSEEQKKQILQANLFRAVRDTLLRRVIDEKQLAEVRTYTAEKIDYERVEKSFIYYVRINDYYFKFRFGTDPRLFIQNPIRVYFESKKSLFPTEDS